MLTKHVVLWGACLGPDSDKPTIKGHFGDNQASLITDRVDYDAKTQLLILLDGIMALWLFP